MSKLTPLPYRFISAEKRVRESFERIHVACLLCGVDIWAEVPWPNILPIRDHYAVHLRDSHPLDYCSAAKEAKP